MHTEQENQIHMQKVYMSILFLICLFVLAFVISQATTTARAVPTETQENAFEAFQGLHLEAEAVYVWDAESRSMLYGRNIEESRPLASLSKVMTALVAHELLKGESLRIKADDLAADGDSGLQIGETWDIVDLIDFTLIVSSNDGARALAGAVGSFQSRTFVDHMNMRAWELGLRNMRFNNPSGLDSHDLSESGGYGSVRDIVHLFDYILRTDPALLEATREDTRIFYSNTQQHTAENTNELINKIPFVIASKTGFTDLAGGNLVVALDVEPDHPIIIGVLGSTREGRFRDVEKLYRATMDYIKQ